MTDFQILHNMAKLLPIELVDKIMDFKYGLFHREKMDKMKGEIEMVGSCKVILTCKPYEVEENVGKDECERIMQILENCDCCERHQKNKPTLKHLQEGYIPDICFDYTAQPKISIWNNNDYCKKCKCPCRHISRLLCMEINDPEIQDNWSDNILQNQEIYENMQEFANNFTG